MPSKPEIIDSMLRVSEFKETDKMFGPYRKQYIAFTDWSPEKEAIANEFNKALNNLREYEKKVEQLLFKKEDKSK